MASVTYDGVASAAGGNIFKDVVFWVAQRVPTRKTIIDHIKNNGGEVVALEKDAHILIADHMRKDTPAGSYSWKFVTDSVEYGIIQIKDRYRIGTQESTPGPPGPRGVAKSTKTSFTHADDVALAKWVLSKNEHDMGNKIYVEFEKINPRHTLQSWRARFTKTLKPMGNDILRRLADEAPESPMDGRGEAAASLPVEHSAHAPDAREDDSAARGQFYSHLNVFRECNNQDVEFENHIGGRIVDLYDLGMEVDRQKVPPDEVDWTTVAEGLGYDGARDESVPGELRRCYEANLVDFLEAVYTYYCDGEEDTGEEADEGFEPAAGETCLPYDVPSSPPVRSIGRKRPLDTQQPPSSSPAIAAKRGRLGPDDEIPSTPDHKIGLGSVQSSLETTPAHRPQSEGLDASPVPLRLLQGRVAGENSPAAAAPPRRSSPNASGAPQAPANTKTPRRSLPGTFCSAAPRGPREPTAGSQQARASPDEASTDNVQQIKECVGKYVALGYPQPVVVEALKRTTMTPGSPAVLVMQSLRDGRGVPTHHEGVWTDRDDRDLRQADAAATAPEADPEEVMRAKKEHRRLMHKHGRERIELRRRFLAAEATEES